MAIRIITQNQTIRLAEKFPPRIQIEPTTRFQRSPLKLKGKREIS